MQTVLVTGAAGLVGSALTRFLLGRDVRVVGCDDFTIGQWEGLSDKLVWEKVDITSPVFLERIDRYDLDAVIHCAAHPGGRSLHEPGKDVEVNALGSMRIFEECARRRIPVVFTSSSVIYGEQPARPIAESAPLHPGTIYGVCKVACENFLRILGEGYGLKWIVLRLFPTYGAGHTPGMSQGIVNIMLTQLLRGDRVIVKGSLRRERDLLYVEDAARVIGKAISVPEAFGHVINVGTGISTTVQVLVETICACLGKRMDNIEVIEEPGTVGDPFYCVADCSKAREILGFVPSYDLKRGLSEMIRERQGRPALVH